MKKVFKIVTYTCGAVIIVFLSLDMFSQIVSIGYSLVTNDNINMIGYHILEIIVCYIVITIISLIHNFLSEKVFND